MAVTLEQEPALCSALLYPGTYYQPPEYCIENAAPGTNYCKDHTGCDDWTDETPEWDD